MDFPTALRERRTRCRLSRLDLARPASAPASPAPPRSRPKEVRKIAAYETADPEVIIAEHVVVGTLPTRRIDFTVPGLLILHIHSGLIARARDYMDSSAVAGARG
ncbi:hypothetical protein [Streptomyces sp. NBC_00385]|uniref:hypothetical protein n=1 Tax=Streptomyces sp. NBC_00385 TaxID=2975733 RepID=UPI002DDB59C4|nr:hypothetical protein [Streptomyces sp. NBC_00385]WRZ08389.1 hypothetical protein OG959_36100 [Streptomyces sp. NBC_00385]